MTLQYIAPGNNPNAPIQGITAGGSVALGELVTLLEGGTASRTSPLLGIANENNTTAGAVSLANMAQNTSANTDSFDNSQNVAILSDGTVAFGYHGDGSSSSNQVHLNLKSPLGGPIADVVVSTDGSIGGVHVIALDNANVAVIWSTSTTLKFAIYSSAASLVKAATVIPSTLPNGSPDYWVACKNASGQLVIAYAVSASGGVRYCRYDGTGTLQGAETTIEAAIAAADLAVTACANGDVVFYYYRANATVGYKFARHSNANAVVVAATALTGATNQTSTNRARFQFLAELANGNLAFSAITVSGYPRVYVMTAAGVPVNTYDYTSSTISANNSVSGSIVPLSDGFAYLTPSTSTPSMNMTLFDNTGLPKTATKQLFTFPNGSQYFYFYGFDAGNGIAIAMTVNDSGTSNYYHRIGVYDFTGAVKGSVITPEADSTNPRRGYCAAIAPNKVMAVAYRDVNALDFRTYRVARCSVLGVATSAAADKGTFNVSTKGSFTLPSTQSFGLSGNFDMRGTVIPGTRGFVVARSANLLGYT